MKQSSLLTITSLLSIVFFIFHLTDDIIRGGEPGGLNNLIGASLIMVVWLYGATVLAGRRSGYIITLLGSVLSYGVPVLHMKGKGVGITSSVATYSGGFHFISMLLALGVLGLFGFILSVKGLWSLPWRRSRSD